MRGDWFWPAVIWSLFVGVLCWWSPPFGQEPIAAAEHRLAAAEQAPLSTDRMRTLPDVSSRWINPPAPYMPKPGTWE